MEDEKNNTTYRTPQINGKEATHTYTVAPSHHCSDII